MKVELCLLGLIGMSSVAMGRIPGYGQGYGSGSSGGYGSGGYGSGSSGGYGSGGYGSGGYGGSSYEVVESSYGGQVAEDRESTDQHPGDESAVHHHEEDRINWEREHQRVINEKEIIAGDWQGYNPTQNVVVPSIENTFVGKDGETIDHTIYKIHHGYDFGTDGQEGSNKVDNEHDTSTHRTEHKEESETAYEVQVSEGRRGFGIHHKYDSGTGEVPANHEPISEEQWKIIISQCWESRPKCPAKPAVTQLCARIISIAKWSECVSENEEANEGFFSNLGNYLYTGFTFVPNYIYKSISG